MKEEIFKDIPGYEGVYQASNLGIIRSLPKKGSGGHNGKILKNGGFNGYKTVILYKNKKAKTQLLHRMIAITFIENIYLKSIVNHIDGNKLNNRLENLEWCTSSENRIHAINILGYKNNFQTNHPMKGKFGKEHNRHKDYIRI